MKALLKEYNATKKHTEAWLKCMEEELSTFQEIKSDIKFKKNNYLLYNLEEIREEELQLLDKQETVRQMLSDINYIINWLRRGGQPNRKRGIERQGVYKREISFEPYWIQLRKDESENVDTIEKLFETNEEQLEDELMKEQQVQEIMKIFSGKQKGILTLKADGYTHEEIAKTMNIPKGTVDVTIKRMREKVKNEGWFMP